MAGHPPQGGDRHRFRLSKWYLDCVTESGEAMIAYWAELGWRRIAARYASVMLLADGTVCERHTLRPGPEPRFADGVLEWSCRVLDAGGRWTGDTCESGARVLHRSDQGTLEWSCLQPLAHSTVQLRERRLEGTGYTERIALSVAPWELPIDELRWGRAHFGGRSVVWIDWRGAEPLRLVLCDGREVEPVQVTDDLVSTHRATVRFSDRRVLREGPVAGSSVGSVPGVRQALSRAGLLIQEQKWLSSATLEEGGVTTPGSAIHEVVRWR
jgi:hypothetical protein